MDILRRYFSTLIFIVFLILSGGGAWHVWGTLQSLETSIPLKTLAIQQGQSALIESLSRLVSSLNAATVAPTPARKDEFTLSLDIAYASHIDFRSSLTEGIPLRLETSLTEVERVLSDLSQIQSVATHIPEREGVVYHTRLTDVLSELRNSYLRTNEAALATLIRKVRQIEQLRNSTTWVLMLILVAAAIMALFIHMQRKYTRQLSEKKSLLETVLESMGQGIVAFDSDLKLAAWNKHFLDIREYPRDLAVEGRDFTDFMAWDAQHNEFGDEDPEQEIQYQISRAGKFLPHHFERQRPNGTFIEVQGGPIPGGGFVSTFTDISQRKEWELATAEAKERAEAANVRLQELDQLKSMFIASMSHELRTPLNSIIGFTGIILQGMSGDLTEDQKDQLGRVYRSAKHLLALISDVIDISKVEAGRVELYGEDFTLSELIDEAIESIRPQLEEKKLACEIDVPQGISMHTDRRRLLQCVLNYFSNAVKYTETGKVAVSVVDCDDSVEISVSDTGIGIPEEELGKVFMPFERIDSHLKVRTPGTGLGLYLTKKLVVEMFHGSVSVKSRPGEGSTFTMVVEKEHDADVAMANRSNGEA